MLDGTKKAGSDLLASSSLTAWTLTMCRKFDGEMPGKIICVYNVRASRRDGELKLDTTDQTQIEFPTDIPEFRPARLIELINNAANLVTEAQRDGVENLSAVFVPREPAASRVLRRLANPARPAHR